MKKVAIITGGSRGIGAAIASQLAADGFAVCINFKNGLEQARALLSKIQNAGGEGMVCQADISQEQALIKLFQETDEKLGSVTALINNAGMNGGVCQVENITYDTLLNVYQTNVFSTFLASREAIKRMKQGGGGSIINITSEAAKFGGTHLAHYASSKAAINTFTIGVAREVAAFNIRVNAVSPGVIDTEIHHASPEDRLQQLLQSLPMKRMGTAEEVARLVSWLASDHSSYMSGAVIPITGAR